ncbi:uncharacterized protein LOC141649547 [Silene latifolia]|uniref:uncharacterized protein LOC141649547 n=1 Tax=Silene latifolia TaxID=37657 RepID=UPI003D781577
MIGGAGSCQTIKVKVDASWKASFKGVIGWVAWNEMRDTCFEESGRIRAESPLQAKALGVRRVLEWARSSGILRLEVSSDCLQLLKQWAGTESAHHQIRGVIANITMMSNFFHYLCFSYISRGLSKRAHDLAYRVMRI